MTVLYILSVLVLCLLVWQQKRKVKVLQEELFSMKEVQEVLITKATIQSREEERQQLARDWHDNMGNIVSTARLLLDSEETPSPPVLQAQQLLEHAHTVARDIYSGVQQPTFATQEQLLVYCEELQHQLGLGGIQFDYSIQEVELSQLSRDQKWHFSNMLKELITNIIKHAQATRIQLDLATIAKKIHLQVRDNGKGFIQPKTTIPKTIQDRLHLLNGQLSIETNTPTGTIMRIEF